MREYKLKSKRSRVKGFPYQLTDWQSNREALTSLIEPFKKYGEEKDGIIAESPAGFAIFTTGAYISKG